MALVLADRVRETTTVTGTGTITLLGAVTGYQSFSTIGDANTAYYCISDQIGANWEVGIGTYTLSGTTLARTTVLASSNAGALVSFTVGTKDVFITYPSEKGVWLDSSGNATGLGTPASGVVTNLTGTASININGTVGATTATTGAFTTLAYTGTLTGGTGVVAIGTNQIVKDASGNVGIGTSVPYRKLDILDTAPVSLKIQSSFLFGGDTYSGLQIGTSANNQACTIGHSYNPVTPANSFTHITPYGSTEGLIFAIAPSGNVGIGTRTPTCRLDVVGVAKASTLSLSGTTAFSAGTISQDVNWGMYFKAATAATAEFAWVSSAGVERMRIDSVGNVTLQENISVGGAAPTTVGTGITFPAANSASSNLNTLDDYEEGTWTPTYVNFTITSGTSEARYTKVGRVITANIWINATSVSCLANATFTLPIAAVSYSAGSAVSSTAVSGIQITGSTTGVVRVAIAATSNLALTVTYQLAS